MSLQHELGLPNPFSHRAHEAVYNIIITEALLAKEGEKILSPIGITIAQINILMLLKYQSVNGRINQTKLGAMLFVNRSNITGLIDRMEKSQMVRRIPDPEDRRVKYVEMTKKGQELLEKAYVTYHERLHEVMSVLNDSDCDSLCSNLESIRKNLY